MNISDQISPINSSWWFYSITPWPDCVDVRHESWRPVSMQFVHHSVGHLSGNLLALLLYGIPFEVYHPCHALMVLSVLQGSVVIGTLAYSFFFPYEGLIGASPGVYGLLGADIILLIGYRGYLDKVVLFVFPSVLAVHLLVDIFLYFLAFNADTAYLSHCFGLLAGLTITAIPLFALSSERRKPSSWIYRFHCLLTVLGIIGFSLLLGFFLAPYLSSRLPQPYINATWLRNDQPSCCEQYLQLLQQYPKARRDEEGQKLHQRAYCDSQNQILTIL